MLLHRLTTLTAAALMTAVLVMPAVAQSKKRVDKAADLPRFEYRIDGKLDDLVRDDAKFASVRPGRAPRHRSGARPVRHRGQGDAAPVLGLLVQLDFLAGRYDAALERAAQVRDLQEKPADKLLSGMQLRAIVGAQAQGRQPHVRRLSRGRGAAASRPTSRPCPTTWCKTTSRKPRGAPRSSARRWSWPGCASVLQPTVDKAGSLSSDLVPGIVNARYALVAALPLKTTMVDNLRQLPRRATRSTSRTSGPRATWTCRRPRLRAGERGGVGQRRRHRAVPGTRGRRRRQAGADRVRQVLESVAAASCCRCRRTCRAGCRR